MSNPTKSYTIAMQTAQIRRLEADLSDSKTMQLAWSIKAKDLTEALKECVRVMAEHHPGLVYDEYSAAIEQAKKELL